MRTFSEHDLDELASELRSGRVAIIPTDTVYGLAAVLDQPSGIEAIYALKGRPGQMPLPVLAADLDAVLSLLGQLPPAAVVLARHFWPGALTLVVPAPAALAAAAGSQDGTVGVRVPALGVARRLLARSGPLAVTSAKPRVSRLRRPVPSSSKALNPSGSWTVVPPRTCPPPW